ncbi:type II toxin-antitoxin system CcdA family antitoxin [Kosakonia sacchari]|uniref:type II toxin-antitoxin system CcdA family antitoxin n=1 Tax=Kosakonia sacchari TaxID=1158459 RepID=UPI00080737C8|nr:type II toxin-antitoxin system CcdA family antitoxin [Kosakonia sacchari]ANR80167.1 antitoxin [Kosakonia sacchari]MDN2485386.1 type II toxin-antitoxin system CcdA family antitoxin [Kosakonia sacchari]NUL38279.1 type II toxin-antitoxin system CcdA family antitoxin [Kosakonia sacchari]
MPATATKQRNKQNVSVTVERDLLEQARKEGINLSQTLTNALQGELRNLEAERWKRENAAAIADLNEFIAERGHFSDEHRKF